MTTFKVKKHYRPTPLKMFIEISRLSPIGILRVFFGIKLNYFKLSELIEQLKTGKTLIRWGDGETALARDKSIWFQSSNLVISKQLNEFWLDNESRIIFSLPKTPIEGTIFKYLNQRRDFFKEFSSRVYFSKKYNEIVNSVFADSKIWYDNHEKLIPMIIDLSWNKPTLLIASNIDIFNSLKTNIPKIEFLQIPKREIFSEKRMLVRQIDSWLSANKDISRPLILLAAGPVGKLIAYEMDRYAQFVDVGHGFILEMGKEIVIIERD